MLFLLKSSNNYAQSKILTLNEALDYAFKNAYSTQLAEQDVKVAAGQVKEAEGKAGPQVKLTGTYLRNSKEIPTTQYLDNFNLGVNASLPLDINSVISLGIQSAKLNKNILESTKTIQYINLRADVKKAGYDIMLNARIVELNSDRYQTTQKNFETIKSKVENKITAKYDQYIAVRDLKTSEASLLSSKLDLKSSKKSFDNLIGSNINEDYHLKDIEEFTKLYFDKKNLWEECLNRPDVQALNYNIEVQKCKRRIEFGALVPSLGLSVNYAQVQKLTSQSAPNINNVNGSITLTVPIIDSGIARARVKQVDDTLEKIEIQKKQLLSQIELSLENALDQLKNAYQQLEVKESGLAAAKEAYRIALLRFNESQAIQLEVSTAKDSLTQVNIDYETSFFDILKAYSEIERITGIAIEKLSKEQTPSTEKITTKKHQTTD